MASRRRLSNEEHELWRRVATSVTPLRRRAAFLPPAPAQPVEQPKHTPKPAPAQASGHQAVQPPQGAPPAVSKKSTALALDKRTAQRLRKGKLPVEGRLDLHGMTQSQAHGALMRFITASRSMNRRLVLIITGKGWDPMASRPEDAIGVLRRSVPRWLETPPLNQHVAAITDAHVKDGGSGALYVLLRRTRRPKHEPEE